MRVKNPVHNQRGQGLIEYLIIVALMGVATIGIMRVMGEAVSKRFATITNALQGSNAKIAKAAVSKDAIKKHDLGDFMNGAAKKDTDGADGDN